MNGPNKLRNPAVELFRCLLMFLIVLGHSWGEGIFFPGRGVCAQMDWWAFLMIGMLIWHVDGFISISGWFGIRFSWKKFAYLLGTVLFYTVVADGIEIWRGAPLRLGMLKLRSGWFGGIYLALMLTAPFLNSAIDALARKSKRHLFAAWFLMAAAFFFTWAPGHLFTGIDARGYGHQTYGMMAFVYVTARVARLLFEKPIRIGVLGGLVGLYLLFVIGLGVYLDAIGNVGNPHFWPILCLVQRNHGPVLYLTAIVFLMIFAWHVRIPDWLGRIVMLISPAMFGVYLFHMRILRPVELWLHAHAAWHPVAVMLCASVVAFGAAVAVDLLRRGLVSLWRGNADALLKRIDGRWSEWVGRGDE